jgi:hypothetical protein
MSETALAPTFAQPVGLAQAELALVQGDLSRLSESQRLQHYLNVCNSLGLNYHTQPFDYLNLNGKLVLYAKKGCTDQLRAIREITTVGDPVSAIVGDVLTVTIKMKDKDGREDVDIGAVSINGLKGAELANAHMRAITKSKRRCTLALCGLGWLDESEVGDIPNRPIVEVVTPPDGPPPIPLKDAILQSLRACRTDADMSVFTGEYLKVKSQLSAPEQAEISKERQLWKAVEVAALPAATVVGNPISGKELVDMVARVQSGETTPAQEMAANLNGKAAEDPIITETRVSNAINNAETMAQYEVAREEFHRVRDTLPMDARSRLVNTAAKRKAAIEKKEKEAIPA